MLRIVAFCAAAGMLMGAGLATALAQQATTTAPEGNATVPERGEENASMQTTRTEAPTAPSGLMPQELPRDELPATDMPSSDLPASDQ